MREKERERNTGRNERRKREVAKMSFDSRNEKNERKRRRGTEFFGR